MVKIFIYLNDVDENNGPHYFVPATHKNFGIKYEIRSKGYSRIDDELIEKHYSNIKKKITGKKGTLIIEDTRGLHKGSVVKDNHRSIVLIQFNNSYFVKILVNLIYLLKIEIILIFINQINILIPI